MVKITRIAYNSADWRRPTGEAAKQETTGSYNADHGFGHEDWLFRDEWQIDGWRYAFIQGVGRSHTKLIRERQPFDVTLFTVQPDKRRRYVASIEAVECLDDNQAESALDVFKTSGWFEQMKEEIRGVQGNAEALESAALAKHVLNVRFRVGNVHRFASGTFAAEDDPIQQLSRYLLIDAVGLRNKIVSAGGRVGSAGFPSLTGYSRSGSGPTQVSPEHARMQLILMKQLRDEFSSGDVVREKNYIDVLVKTPDELRLYEIKSDLSPRTVLRLAIGQLLEYFYFHIQSEGRNVTLVVVGRNPLSNTDSQYLAYLRDRMGLPLEYRVVSV